MYTERDSMITLAIGLATQMGLYLFLAYILANLLYGGSAHVNYVLILFAIVGITSMLVGFVSTTVAWLTYSRRRAIVAMLECLRVNQFPMRRWKGQSFANYLANITENYDNDPQIEPLRKVAKEIEQTFVWSPTVGFSQGWRMLRAWEAAFERYSPNSEAPRAY